MEEQIDFLRNVVGQIQLKKEKKIITKTLMKLKLKFMSERNYCVVFYLVFYDYDTQISIYYIYHILLYV